MCGMHFVYPNPMHQPEFHLAQLVPIPMQLPHAASPSAYSRSPLALSGSANRIPRLGGGTLGVSSSSLSET